MQDLHDRRDPSSHLSTLSGRGTGTWALPVSMDSHAWAANTQHGLAAAPTMDGSAQGAMEITGPAGIGTLAINPQGSWLVGLLWLQDKLS